MLKQIDNFIAWGVYQLWEFKEGNNRIETTKSLAQQQWLSPEDIAAIQLEKLKHILGHAKKTSPWYSERLKHIDIEKTNTLEVLLEIPVTTKIELRENTAHFISNQYNIEELVMAKTGGSTGTSLNLYFDKLCQQKRNGAQNFADSWAGWKPGYKTAALWGNPPTADTLKKRLRSALLERSICLDTMKIDQESIKDFLVECQSFKPDILFGHAHSIYILAKYIVDNNIEAPPFKGIIATSMMLLDNEREIIQQVFKQAVTNRYGCEEVGLIACECEQHKGMHINSSHVIVECLDDNDKPVPQGQPGKLVITDLNNFGMPLIRYRVEDVGVLSNRQCPCGRQLPFLERLEGRVADFLKTDSGGQVSGISLIERTLTKIPGIEQMQLVQNSLESLEINRVKGHEYNDHTDTALKQELADVFGDKVELIINDVPSIPQLKNGKFRFSICNLQVDVRP
ncbi:phenylacetate--CoA ligase family protein [Oceanicoccus sagamiensis]|uniref:Capsule biosynthesis protein CapK n=1 Tax=Oceanicoccus sagamiensis TaxID=716816 RepID=A0A1X9NKP3_9GAMM|nr:phenylacetate--CoA ligase family protein [Oceanicoccus sagamiensis]ARN74523.1 hypothetical protein BST96_10565 [Oceanicoccus sagamiensis]